jgi:hypothetical protein
VISPNGGEFYYDGQAVPISWSSVNVNQVSIEISSNNGSTWSVIIPSEFAVVGNTTWVASGFYGQSTLLVRILDLSNPALRDTSNAAFTIPVNLAQKHTGGAYDGHGQDVNTSNSLILSSPNGGERLADNAIQTITWASNNIANVRLEYSTNNGSNWILISASETANSGFYNWTVPVVNTLNGRIRVSDVLNQGTSFDISDASFIIQIADPAKHLGGSYDGHSVNLNVTPTITVTSPNGGELFYEGPSTFPGGLD